MFHGETENRTLFVIRYFLHFDDLLQLLPSHNARRIFPYSCAHEYATQCSRYILGQNR